MKNKSGSLRLLVPIAAVSLANAIIMSVELLATRLLFPRFGNTIFTWSAIISIIIAGLFFGYMAGGMAADKSRDKSKLMAHELMAAGLLVMAVPWLSDHLLVQGAAVRVMPSLWACFAVFGLPAAALASTPPAVVGLLTEEGRGPAFSAGFVSALSAAGSIAGTLLTAFTLVPSYGVRGLFIAYGIILGAAALAVRLAGRKSSGKGAAVPVILYALALAGAAKAGIAPPAEGPAPVFYEDSRYQLVRVYEQGAGKELIRTLTLDSTQEGAMRIADKQVVFGYTRAYRLFLNALAKDAQARILFIGGGAFSMPIRVAEGLPRSRVQVAEIDPVVADIGKRFFRTGETPNLETLLADGRQVVRRESGRLDGIFIDAYQGVFAVPFHLTTKEFFEEVGKSLVPDGFVALNLIGNPVETEGFFCSVTETLKSVFPEVRVHPIHGFQDQVQNVIIVAGKRSDGVFKKDLLAGTGFREYAPSQNLLCRPGPVLTDDHAPVEWLVAKYIGRSP